MVEKTTNGNFSKFQDKKEKEKMKIMFICKYNAFRSKVAESYFRKINKNKNIKVSSAGFIYGGEADKIQKVIAKKLGAEIKGKPRRWGLKELERQDIIIVVANDIPKIMFNYQLASIKKKVVIWKIKDEQKQNEESIVKIINQIKRKVEKLIKRLENRR